MDESGISETGGTSNTANSKNDEPLTDSTNCVIGLEVNKSAGCQPPMPEVNTVRFGLSGG